MLQPAHVSFGVPQLYRLPALLNQALGKKWTAQPARSPPQKGNESSIIANTTASPPAIYFTVSRFLIVSAPNPTKNTATRPGRMSSFNN